MQVQTRWAGGYTPPKYTASTQKERVVREIPSRSIKHDNIIDYLRTYGPSSSGDIARGLHVRHSPVCAALKRMCGRYVMKDDLIWRLRSPDEPPHKSKAEVLTEWLKQHPDASDLEASEGLGVPRVLVAKMLWRLTDRGLFKERQVCGTSRFTVREGG